MKRETKILGATLAGIVAVCTMIAAVPGIFSSVNSTAGYQVNGSAGTPGNALCSDGTYYSLPCSVAGSFTAAGDLSGSSSSQNVVGIQTHPLPSLAVGFLNWNGTNWLYTPITLGARTCNANGCYQLVNGVYHQWGVTASFDTGPSTVSLPITMVIESVQVTQCYDSSAGCSGGSTTSRQWQTGNWTGSTFDVRNNGVGQARWDAWGH